VYGLLYRSDRNYNEAIKAYKQALKIDKDNLQILRDLSLLQIQMRDLSGFAVTRHTILNLKPNNTIHWLAFALAKHLTGDNDGAINVIDSYLNTLDEKSREKQRGVESSELALYRFEVLQEIPNNSQTALTYLEQCKDLVVDQTSWMFAKAKCQLALGFYADAKDTFLALFHRGSIEDYRFHSGYMCALLHLDKETCDSAMKLRGINTVATTFPLNSMQKRTLFDAYTNELTSLFPSSAAVARIPQTLLEGEALRICLDKYCRENLKRGVPSLAQSLRSLFIALVVPKDDASVSNGDAIPCKNLHVLRAKQHYVAVRDPVEVKRHPVAVIIIELADSYVKSLSNSNTFPGNDEEESPSTLLWSMYLRVKLHQFCGEYEEGLRLIDQCIAHTPTCVDMYELKGRLLKLSGDIGAAADCLDSGRALDLQDRYINNKTAKYLLRADRDIEALERIALFTKDEGNPDQHLFSMQCTWYELEVAACYVRKGELGKALKKYSELYSDF
jgi:peptide alpha-N-acetyltransferase